MEAEIREIVANSLIKAKYEDSCGNVGQAYAYYTVVVELCPEKREELEEIYTDVLCEWGMRLEQKNKIKDLIKCYKVSILHYSNSPRMLNNFAGHLLRIGEPSEAIKYLKRVIEAKPSFLPAQRNLQNAYSMVVNEWHFCMLNDSGRNNAFHDAIAKAVEKGCKTVLDIGTGTGLLSLYALNSGAEKVYACEYSPILCDIATRVFNDNKATNIKLLRKISHLLQIPQDLDEKVKLIVTETFDAAIFGEGILPTLIHAHKNLLEKNGTIIPKSASLVISAVECDYIRSKTSFNPQSLQKFSSINFPDFLVISDEELYDTENLKNLDLLFITEPQEILSVDFNDLGDLENLSQDGTKNEITLKCCFDGTIDCLLLWMKLNLDDEITIDSSRGKSCWQYAVFPAASTKIQEKDEVEISLEMRQANVKCSYKTNTKIPEYKLPNEVISFLNDLEYAEKLVKVAQEKKSTKIKNVLDTCPFPLYGLEILKNCGDCEKLFFQTDNEMLRNFVVQVAKNNEIQEKRIHFIKSFEEIKVALDDVYIQNFDVKGEPKDWGQHSSFEFFRSLLSPSGSILPQKCFLMGQLIFSQVLPNMMRVQDAHVQGHNISSSTENFHDDAAEAFEKKCKITNSATQKITIAKFINEYSTNQVFDLNSSLYPHEILSEEKILVEMGDSGESESIADFGKINTKLIPNALLCWYKLGITKNQEICTKRKLSFINHAAIIMEEELKNMSSGNKNVELKVYKMGDFVKITPLL